MVKYTRLCIRKGAEISYVKEKVCMSQLVVQNYDAENKANIFHYAITGGLTGYAAKYALPITDKERLDNDYSGYVKRARSQLSEEMAEFREAIQKDAVKKDAASKIFVDTFVPNQECEQILESKAFKSAKQTVKDDVKLLVDQYNLLKSNGEKNAKIMFDTAVKGLRSVNTFLGVGVLAGLTVALAKNALDAHGRKLEQQRLLDSEA